MQRQDHLPVLDGVRFACALSVLCYHFLAVFPLAASSVTRDFDPALVLPSNLPRYTWWGWVGVDLFFVVSGYVIATSAVQVGAAPFVRRRALRLLPAAWICATLTAIVLLIGSSVPAADVATRWATSMALFPLGQPIDEIYWTLGVEVAFYALVATQLRDRDNRRRLTLLGAALGLASLTFWLGRHSGALLLDPQSTPVRLLLLPHGGFFAVGIALHALSDRRGTTIVWLALGSGLVAGASEIVALAATMAGVPGFTADPAIPLAIFGAGVTAIVLAPRVRGTKAWPGWALLGAMTYPLYLLNQRFAAGLLTGLRHAGIPAGWAVAAAIALVTVLAGIIAHAVEPRLRRWLAAQLSSRRGPAPDTHPTAFPRAG